MTVITAIKGDKLVASSKDTAFKKAVRSPTAVVGDIVDTKTRELEVVAKFDGADINEFYEAKLQETPYPVTYRRSVKQLSKQFGTDPSLGGVLMRKKGSNVFVFVPNDISKDKVVKAVIK